MKDWPTHYEPSLEEIRWAIADRAITCADGHILTAYDIDPDNGEIRCRNHTGLDPDRAYDEARERRLN